MNASHRDNIFNPVGPMPRAEREQLLKSRGLVLWFTGLSGSGKSTIARGLERALVEQGRMANVLDGDEIRNGLNRDLGFSQGDREENIRRIAEVAKLFADCGVVCITSFISPLRAQRDMARAIVGAERFLEVFIDADLATCEARDAKGLYKKARAGEIRQFTGIDSVYEPPVQPACRLATAALSPEACVRQLVALIRARDA